MQLAQGRMEWWAILNTVINLRLPYEKLIPWPAVCSLNWNHIPCKSLVTVAETIMAYFYQLKTNSTVTEKIRAIYNQRKGKYKVLALRCKMS